MLVQNKMGITPENQRLLYGNKELEDTKNGDVMTFEKYEITADAIIVLVTRLPGGYTQSNSKL